eukprot:CAMPEP_0179267240 /NCGR_PEP_ID=MMETSP0797-20121207/29824_1 /TAXON_ID=47934 /ORGANISM="Dinophysis acuminata, Strain DAEP01" /LENGTH=411 /DNA_ID=CAMNT_0020975487 /DNA_START=3 /DNA_END=1234 /DNA_ORIENTATION=-
MSDPTADSVARLDQLGVPEEKKKYILEVLNPLLDEMAAECIHKMPKNPVSFMLEFLEGKKADDEDKLLSLEERDRIILENKHLAEEMVKLKSHMQEVAMVAAANETARDEAEEEDDDDVEPPPDFDKFVGSKTRASVSAEAFGEWNTKKVFVPPIVAKTDDQKEKLRAGLCQSFLFSSLEENDIVVVVGAMREVEVAAGAVVITQGDSGDFLFYVEKGALDCVIKDAAGAEQVVSTCSAGGVFGELALLYNCPRAATVRSKEPGVLWKLDRATFGHIVKDSAEKKRARYDAFLARVPVLLNLSPFERSQLADVLRVESFADGQTVVSQGETGHVFYIVEEGAAVATKGGAEVMKYGPGDYFGELALILDQPRAATVTVKGHTKLLSIDSGSFKRLLNVSDLLERSAKYDPA